MTASADLVARIRGGEPGSEEELIQRFSRGITFLLRRVTRDPATAEDLHQETFRLAIEKIRNGEVRDPEKLPGYIASLARNLATEDARRGIRRDQWHDRDPERAEQASDPEPGQLSTLLRKEHAAIVRRVIGELEQDRDRQLLFRYYIAEEDKEQICRDLALDQVHFNRVLFRARQRYKDLYEKRQLGFRAVPPPTRAPRREHGAAAD
ncbi:MAG TPA: sigma-70 family RNA polymerase sigma factor [Thermoanaerobaculia bacterium]|nr:sigma-70 family RNA polymerase sigma factor [Thermoanaerobaculia bacterium]